MTYKLTILPESELCLIAYSKRVSDRDFGAARDALRSSPNYALHFDELIAIGPHADYSEISYEITYAWGQAYAAEARDIPRPKRLAFVCGSRPIFAMAHIFGACVSASGSRHVDVECFVDLHSALDWIEQGEGDRSLDRKRIARLLNQMGHAWCCPQSAVA